MRYPMANALLACFVVVVVGCGIMAYREWQAHKNDRGTAQAAIDAEIVAEVAEATKSGALQELPPGKKLVGVTITGMKNTIVYLVRPMRPDETPEVYQLTSYETDPPAWVIREHAAEKK